MNIYEPKVLTFLFRFFRSVMAPGSTPVPCTPFQLKTSAAQHEIDSLFNLIRTKLVVIADEE